jgi:hypothetical protein
MAAWAAGKINWRKHCLINAHPEMMGRTRERALLLILKPAIAASLRGDLAETQSA